VDGKRFTLLTFREPCRSDLIIRDRDPSFDGDEIENILKSTETRFLRCPRHAPKANCFVERLNRTLQEERTDHFLFFSERQLENTLKTYRRYYNKHRAHQGLAQKIPCPEELNTAPPSNPLNQHPKPKTILGGLRHRYDWAA
jgi:hypothetical protein